ncbi:PREDICTED: AP-3 complex subunit delta [Nelumbo nucifera]|uniref:AP-3 complex subunit delta n=1 Tax=Nelumbo nucifera TaxID=4432 RepID=A0A1U7ZEM5_NELNU|nr:PREDICTED: AP-3 complex subunit delta [Nelumbo nucifera]
MSASSIMESLFQRSLDDLIKGIRLQLIGESKFITKAMEEIRREIKTTDSQTKAVALEKLTYLNSIHGIDMSWAAFHVVEVMSSSRFAHKKIGYLAASQSFNEGTDVILLITNQLRKDLTSTNEFEVGLALECLSVIATTDLARDLTPEIFTLLSSSKTFVRKKAVAVILRIFVKYPDAVKVSFKRLVENLENSDPHVMSAAVGVFCELASKDPDPRLYLPLAPEFYRILVDCKNNWILIKVLKIFAKLLPLEPRLAKRVVDPICEHMRRTGAKSLMFECIRTVVTTLTDYESAVKLAVEKIRELLVDDDPNLKYLGLQALSILGAKHLWPVLENKDVVINSLSDADPNIKLEALHLVMGMVSETNVAEISRVLVNYALKSEPQFCNEILGSILSTCGRNFYEIVVDFDWYVSLLGEMSRNPHCQKGEEIESQFVDIGLRVKDARPELVRVARDLLIDPALLGNPFLHRILAASAWVSGEYVEFSKNPFELMEALLQPRTSLLPPLIRAVYIHSAFKVLVFCLHSYLVQREVIHPSSVDDLATGMPDLGFGIKCVEVSDIAKCQSAADCGHDDEFNPRVSDISVEDSTMETTRDITVHEASSSVSLQKEPFTHESILNLLNLVKMALGPHSGTDEVEVQDRAQNVLGFIKMIEQELHGLLGEEKGNFEIGEHKVPKIIELMYNAFSKELGPVSVSAQERVPIPDGLMLKEDLSDLDNMCADVLKPPSSSFTTGNPQFGEREGDSFFNLHGKEPEPSTESTLLLAQHRKQHGLYYLPSDKNETVSNDYPPANEPPLLSNLVDGTQDLMKLTEQSLASKKKSNHAKPRPVVVKLDEGDELPVSATKLTKESKDDSLSGALRDILLGDKVNPMSSQRQPSDKSSGKREKEALVDSGYASRSKQNLGDAQPSHGSSSSRRSKHRSHGKEKQRSPRRNNEGKEDTQKDKKKGSHHHRRHKTRQRADGPPNVISQTPVIPDFLL